MKKGDTIWVIDNGSVLEMVYIKTYLENIIRAKYTYDGSGAYDFLRSDVFIDRREALETAVERYSHRLDIMSYDLAKLKEEK